MTLLKRRFYRWLNALESEFSNPKKFYENACTLVSQYLAISGCERFEQNYTRLNARFVFVMVDIVVFLAVSIWSLTTLWGQWLEFIFCFVTIGMAVQGLVKIYMFTQETIYDLYQYNRNRFENTKRLPKIHGSFMRTASLCTASVKLMGPCYAFMGTFTVMISVIISVIYERFELPFGFFLPGLDRATWIGYMLNLAFQALQALETVIGLLAADMLFFNLMINAVGQLDVLIICLHKLGETVTEDNIGETQQYDLLTEMIEKHLEHRMYLSKMESLMKVGFFINNGCLIAETVTSLYIVITNDEIWIPGIMIAVFCAFQLVIPSFMGSLLSSKNDELIREIYNTPWNVLPIPAQHALKLFLQSAQNPVTLSDGFAPIDLDNFLEIYKKIYSYLAMIQNLT